MARGCLTGQRKAGNPASLACCLGIPAIAEVRMNMSCKPAFRDHLSIVMAGLVPGIHVLPSMRAKDVDGRDKPGHDYTEIE